LPPVGPTELIVGTAVGLLDVDGGRLAVGDGLPLGAGWVGSLVGVVDGEAGVDEPGADGGGLVSGGDDGGLLSVGGCGLPGCVSLPGGAPEFWPGGRPGSDEVGVGVGVGVSDGPGWPGMVTGGEPGSLGSPGSVDSVHEGCSVGMAVVEVALAVAVGVSVGRQVGASEVEG